MTAIDQEFFDRSKQILSRLQHEYNLLLIQLANPRLTSSKYNAIQLEIEHNLERIIIEYLRSSH